MKLRNKRTGEIYRIFYVTPEGEIAIMTTDGTVRYINSLTELNEEWEDVPEEPKGYFYIRDGGNIDYYRKEVTITERHKSIGNYFETKEEAEKAVENLRAWKRLKDKGFRFKNSSLDICSHTINFIVDNQYDMTDETSKDLFLLLGGEE